jgi:beta-lactam-binding protein with PASTA domain
MSDFSPQGYYPRAVVEPPPNNPQSDPPLDPDETVVAPRDDRYVAEDEIVEEQPQRVPPLVWPWLLALLLVVLGGLGAYWWFTKEDKNDVPAVVGHREQAAEAEVRDAGFEPETRRDESAKPRGFVISQNPEAGTELEEGKTVILIVSAGPGTEAVPDVVGKRRDEAVAAVQAAGFDAKVTEVFADKPDGIVVETDPAAGTSAEKGSVVELKVSKGGKTVTVPDVVGTTSSEATKTLQDSGFKVNLVAVPSDQPAGTVLAQNPKAGGTAKQGTIVRLNVARSATDTTPGTTAPPPPPPAAPATATVPDVVGKELADGARDFADEGLKVDVRYVPSREAAGRIVAQSRPAGTKLKRGDTVQLNVSEGANPQAAASVPEVTGSELKDAREQLEKAGFEVLALDISGRNRTGHVLSQTPRGGASIPRGSLVLLYVGD